LEALTDLAEAVFVIKGIVIARSVKTVRIVESQQPVARVRRSESTRRTIREVDQGNIAPVRDDDYNSGFFLNCRAGLNPCRS
jgi:hypothetical protein